MRTRATGRRRHVLWASLLAVVALGVSSPARADSGPSAMEMEVDAADLIRRAEDALRGNTAIMQARMTITTPRWTREVVFRSWDDREKDRSFIRILEPIKDRGSAFLRVNDTFWTYLPRVERTTRLPPSMMLQAWMGSDFTNDDVARESSMIDDYVARFLGKKPIEGQDALGVELTPRDEAPVVWSKVEAWLVADSLAPLLYLYYDEPKPGEFELLRRLQFSEVADVSGRPFPHRWVMESIDKPGHTTQIRIEEIRLDETLPDSIFTHRHLKRPDGSP